MAPHNLTRSNGSGREVTQNRLHPVVGDIDRRRPDEPVDLLTLGLGRVGVGIADRTADAALPSPSATAPKAPLQVIGAAADTLHELHLLAERAEAVLGHPDSVPAWFASDVGALGRTRPLDWLDTTAGRERIVEVLDAIAYGFPG